MEIRVLRYFLKVAQEESMKWDRHAGKFFLYRP